MDFYHTSYKPHFSSPNHKSSIWVAWLSHFWYNMWSSASRNLATFNVRAAVLTLAVNHPVSLLRLLCPTAPWPWTQRPAGETVLQTFSGMDSQQQQQQEQTFFFLHPMYFDPCCNSSNVLEVNMKEWDAHIFSPWLFNRNHARTRG